MADLKKDYITIRESIWENNRSSQITYAEITAVCMLALLFIGSSFITDCEILLSIIVYVFAARATQSDGMFAFNLSFVLPYGIVSLILCAIIEGAAPTDKELTAELARRSAAFRGVPVSGLSISVGTAQCGSADEVSAAAQDADRQMYSNKEAYYRKTDT